MSQLEQTPGLLTYLRGEMTPKFLATRSAEGIPNVVPCISLLPAGDLEDTLFFGNFLLRKSIKNLKEDRRVGILVVTPELKGWILKGDFIEFHPTGPYVDLQKSSPHLRYNAYTGVRNAGLIRVNRRFTPAARPIREDESSKGGGDGYCIPSSCSRWGELS